MKTNIELLKSNFFIIFDSNYDIGNYILLEKIKFFSDKLKVKEIILILKLDYQFYNILSFESDNPTILNNLLNNFFQFKMETSILIAVEMNNYTKFKKLENLIDIFLIYTYETKEIELIKYISRLQKIIIIKNNIFGYQNQVINLKKIINNCQNNQIVICESSRINYMNPPNYLKLNIFESNNNRNLICLDISDDNYDIFNQSQNNIVDSNNLNQIKNFNKIVFNFIEVNGVYISRHQLLDNIDIHQLIKNLIYLIKSKLGK